MSLMSELRSVPHLFGDAVEQLGKLVQNEIELAKAEISEKVAQASMGVAYLAGAAILIIPVGVLLLMALALWVTTLGLAPALAHLVSAACGAAVSTVLAVLGLKYLKADNLKPKATIQQVEKDVTAAKEMVR